MRPQRKKLKNPDRLPPHSEEAEQMVLGCVLLSPVENLSECQEAGLVGEWFYDLRHQLIWSAVEGLGKEGKPIDVITVMERVKEKGSMEQIGGIEYLWKLPDLSPGAQFLRVYLPVVKQKFQLRQALKAATQLAMGVYEFEGDVEAVLGQAEKSILGLREIGHSSTERGVREVLRDEVLADLEEYHRGSAQIKGLTTGLEYLDKMFCGLGGSEDYLHVLAGRPGTGKTSLGMQIGGHVAMDHEYWVKTDLAAKERIERKEGEEGPMVEKKRGLPVGIFSLEMTARGLVSRMLFQRAGADLQRMRSGYGIKQDFDRLRAAALELGQAQIWIDDTRRQSIEGIKAKMRRWKQQHGIGLFVVDYFQLITSATRTGQKQRQTKREEFEDISGELQRLGGELRVPIILLAQMNRDFEKVERPRPPQLSDLKDCGAIEQDADSVSLLHRANMSEGQEEFWDEALSGAYPEDWVKHLRVDLEVAKHRYAMTGPVQLLFHRSWTGFEDANVWLKKRGLKAPAKGERGYGSLKSKGSSLKSGNGNGQDEEGHVRGSMPTNEELGI